MVFSLLLVPRLWWRVRQRKGEKCGIIITAHYAKAMLIFISNLLPFEKLLTKISWYWQLTWAINIPSNYHHLIQVAAKIVELLTATISCRCCSLKNERNGNKNLLPMCQCKNRAIKQTFIKIFYSNFHAHGYNCFTIFFLKFSEALSIRSKSFFIAWLLS